VTTGGASVGDHDLVVEGLGPRLALEFWKVAMRPGKPLLFGRLGDTPLLGLPGNPVSAMVCAVLFLVPAIERISGLPGRPPPVVDAVLAADVAANDLRMDHLRATLVEGEDGLPRVTPYARQDSAMFRLFANADALVVRAPHAPALAAGAHVPIIRLDMLGL
jgi:molybdopterin molybdotransferase